MNCVRKHLSAIKGGRLAAAARPARVVTLAISDVPGDDPAVIASGPTVPDPTTFADARAIIARYGIKPSAAVAGAAGAGNGRDTEARRPAQQRIPPDRHADDGAARMAETARGLGLAPLVLGDALEGEAREMGIVLAGIARSIRTHGQPLAPPAVMLSGGETTVTLGRGPAGHGGRNTEFLLALAVALGGAAGHLGDRRRHRRHRRHGRHRRRHPDAGHAGACPRQGLDPRAMLAGHDSHTLFDAIGDAIRTGPTLTNVNDVRAILIA